MRAQRQARQILTDATIHATLTDQTIANLDLAQSGYPETTPGASPPEPRPSEQCHHPECTLERPCPDHDDNIHLTIVERLATQPDKARRDLETYIASSTQAAHHLAILARIDQQWGYVGLDTTTIRERIHQIDADIWCNNCTRYGRHETRSPGRLECDYCADFRQKRRRTCPPEIWEARDARGGRLDETTIIRILKRVDEDRKANAAAARQRQRAEPKVS